MTISKPTETLIAHVLKLLQAQVPVIKCTVLCPGCVSGEEQSSGRGADHSGAAPERSQREGAGAAASTSKAEDHRQRGAQRLQTQEEEGQRLFFISPAFRRV